MGATERNSASRQESSDKATKICTRCAEKVPGLPIQVNNHVCSGCRREFFDRNDLYAKAKTGRSKNALLCGYSANSCSTMTKLKLITIFLFQRWGEMIKEEPRPGPCPRSRILIGGETFIGKTFIRV